MTNYEYGFLTKCAEYGLDGMLSSRMLKYALYVNNSVARQTQAPRRRMVSRPTTPVQPVTAPAQPATAQAPVTPAQGGSTSPAVAPAATARPSFGASKFSVDKPPSFDDTSPGATVFWLNNPELAKEHGIEVSNVTKTPNGVRGSIRRVIPGFEPYGYDKVQQLTNRSQDDIKPSTPQPTTPARQQVTAPAPAPAPSPAPQPASGMNPEQILNQQRLQHAKNLAAKVRNTPGTTTTTTNGNVTETRSIGLVNGNNVTPLPAGNQPQQPVQQQQQQQQQQKQQQSAQSQGDLDIQNRWKGLGRENQARLMREAGVNGAQWKAMSVQEKTKLVDSLMKKDLARQNTAVAPGSSESSDGMVAVKLPSGHTVMMSKDMAARHAAGSRPVRNVSKGEAAMNLQRTKSEMVAERSRNEAARRDAAIRNFGHTTYNPIFQPRSGVIGLGARPGGLR